MNRFAAFRELHYVGRPLFLPNAWDYASAAILTRDGHPAIGTTSLGVAVAAGKPDATAAARVETVALTRALGRLPSLITVDIEAGFSDDPYEVADLAAELADAGAVGVNLEDGRPDGTLTSPALHGEKIAAVKDRVPELFVNARTDPFWLRTDEPLAEALRRGADYVEAGADGIFVPGVADDASITRLVDELDAPLNVLYLSDQHTLSGLARLRVARVSTGSLLFRTALGAAVRAAATIRNGGVRTDPQPPSYADIQELTGQPGSDG